MKTGRDTLGTAENEFGNAKHEKRPNAHGTAENVFGSAQHENWTRRPRIRRKRVRVRKTWKRDPTPSVPPKTSLGVQNMKTGPVALGTSENKFGSEKHEYET
jgi:hypothetical protein